MALDRRERSGDLIEGVRVASEGQQAKIWTAMPGIVQSWDPAKRTAVIQPAIQARVQNPDGTEQWVTLPLLVDCPIQFPGGGDVVITFPLKLGDECLVVFASRCIDSWWQSGGIQVQAELRMHSLSDGFCVPGVSSVPNVETAISTTEAQMRSRDGVTRVRLNPASHTVVTDTTGAAVTVKPNEIDANVGTSFVIVKPAEVDVGMSGAGMTVTPGRVDLFGSLFINGKAYLTHHHSGVTSGASNTGDVVP